MGTTVKGIKFSCNLNNEISPSLAPAVLTDRFVILFILCVCVCVIHCVVIPFILDIRLVDAPAGVTQEEGHTGFLHLPSAVLALIFIARRVQPPLSIVDHVY